METIFQKLGNKIKSNKAVQDYMSNMSINKHMQKQVGSKWLDNIDSLDDLKATQDVLRMSGSNEAAEALTEGIEKKEWINYRTVGNIKDWASGDMKTKDTYKVYSNMYDDIGRSEGADVTSFAHKGKKAFDTVGGYLSGSDGVGNYNTKQAIMRTGTAMAGVVGANVGARFVTGGSLTRNGKGEKDVMGVPFI